MKERKAPPPSPGGIDHPHSDRTLLRSTAAVAFPTIISRILGYVRDLLQAYFMGTSRGADEFTMAYTIPNLLRRLTGEGAMTAAFIPVFTQVKEDNDSELWRFANLFFFDLSVIMAGITVIGMVLAPFLVRLIAVGYADVPGKWELTIVLTRIMFPYIFVVSLAALAMGILNSFRKFFVPAFTPVLFNLAVITAAGLFAAGMEEPAYAFAIGVVVGGLLQLLFQIPFLFRQGMRFRFGLSFKHPYIRKVFRLMLPGIFGVGIAQINLAISRMIASMLKQESVASLWYATRVQELTLGIFSIALSIALLPTFSSMAARQDIPGIKRTLGFSLRLIFFINFPAMAGLMVLNKPIIRALFEYGVFDASSTAMSASCLLFLAAGLPFISGVKIIAPVFYSMKDTKTPVIAAFIVMISYIPLSFLLMGPMKVAGIALALSLSSMVNFVILFLWMERKIGSVPKKKVIASGLKSALAAGVMALAVGLFIRNVPLDEAAAAQKVFMVLAAVALGMAVYVVIQLLFNQDDLRSLRTVFSRKGKRPGGEIS